MSASKTILAFDIGIRNLAWCLLEGSKDVAPGQQKHTILGWQNYDLLTGQGAEVAKVKMVCHKCSVKAAFTNPIEPPTCLRHCPATHPPLKDLSGVVLKKMPYMKSIRRIVPTIKAATKTAMITSISLLHSLPYEPPKVKKALEMELTTIHDAIRTFVRANLESFRKATHILLENQPVLKNPTMKSVQILLFATLRDMLQPGPPPLKLVHAGKKISGMETGDKGYKSRKDASEAKVVKLLEDGKVGEQAKWLAYFKGHGKKSDLADAMCMCWDMVAT